VPVEFEQLRDRARPWMEPVPGALPAGAPAKLEPEYQTVADEVAKLDAPSRGRVDWKKVADGSGQLLRTRTKDLVLGAYLAHALHVTGGIEGLTTGVTFLADLLAQYWDTLYPDAKRPRARVSALQWFLERTQQALVQEPPPEIGIDNVEALASAAKKLAEVTRARFAESAPALSPLLEGIDKLHHAVVARSAPRPVPSQTEGATVAVPVQPPAPELANADDPTEFLRTIGASLISSAGVLRRADAMNPASYRILRVGLWLHLSSAPPASGATTRVPPLPDALRKQAAVLAQNQKWAALLEEAESALPDHRFALDLQRLSWQALAGLGSSSDRAREAIAAEVRSLLVRMPLLPRLAFADGSPLADPQTQSWLDREIASRQDHPPAGEAAGNGSATRLEEAKQLLQGPHAAEALKILHDWVETARGGRERFLARLELARLAAGAGLLAVANATYEELEREAVAHDLDRWEPQLVAGCLKGLIAAWQAAPQDPRTSAAEVAAAYRRLCRIDPVAALEVWP
jgi:type VI secretion system protein VasJ